MAVDASGVVSSVLSNYRQVLVEYQRRVTGDPAALEAAANRCGTNASTITGKATEIADAATALHADWDGAAYTAYATAASDVAHALTEDGTKLADQGKRLSMAGQLLRWARSGVDSVAAQFEQYGTQLINQARSADPNAVGAFIAAARDLGEQAVAAAGQVADELSDALAELFPAPWAGPMSKPGKLGKRNYGPLSWVNGDTLDGRKRPRSAPSWFGNSGWKKLTWNGLEGTRAPKKADTPFGQPKLKSEIARATEITYYKTAHEQDGFIPEYDGKISSQGWDAKASGHAELGFREDIGTSGSYGVAHGSARGSAFAGGEVSASGQLGIHGLGVHANAFAGGKLEGQVAADVAGVGVGASGSVQYGIGAQLDGQFVYDSGHLKMNFKAGAALGLGAGLGAKIDIDLPKVGAAVSEYGGAAVDAVGDAASEAANALGGAWDDAAQYVGSW
ncbi:WXG100 family type VII secretion target [Amycolatopsis sp. NPDC004079]|uniref:WXG100 family type VII secretion target n=1 Tax=Amycolatopsis sp. NPDC004079 TaxID=3154549 RepID=UPI00339EF693